MFGLIRNIRLIRRMAVIAGVGFGGAGLVNSPDPAQDTAISTPSRDIVQPAAAPMPMIGQALSPPNTQAPYVSIRPMMRAIGPGAAIAPGLAPRAVPIIAPQDDIPITQSVAQALADYQEQTLPATSPAPADQDALIENVIGAVLADPNPPSFGSAPPPRPSPPDALQPNPIPAPPPLVALSQYAPILSLRPNLRPANIAARQDTPVAARPSGGGICGLADVVGTPIAPITSRQTGCGIAQPVRVESISGIELSTAATLNCDTVRALHIWVNQSLIPETRRFRGGVRSMRIMGSYSCRTRNSQSGARLSEHSTGNAIDIGGFNMGNGTTITVLENWGQGRPGRILQSLHSGACGPFGTVLGPDSDRFHQDHFHFDVADYRSGPYCR
jgi:hypothetical protein